MSDPPGSEEPSNEFGRQTTAAPALAASTPRQSPAVEQARVPSGLDREALARPGSNGILYSADVVSGAQRSGAGLGSNGRLHGPSVATLSALALAMILPLAIRSGALERTLATRMNNPNIEARIEAGRWLASQAPPDAPVLYDAYAYLPPAVVDTRETFGLTLTQIDAFQPRFILTDSDIRDRFLDSSAATRYRDGPAAYATIAATYRELEQGSLPCYALLRRFGPVSIYGRTSGACAP